MGLGSKEVRGFYSFLLQAGVDPALGAGELGAGSKAACCYLEGSFGSAWRLCSGGTEYYNTCMYM